MKLKFHLSGAVLLLMVLALLLVLPVLSMAQEVPDAATPEATPLEVASVEATAVPAVTVNIDTTPDASGGYDGWLLLTLATFGAGLIYAILRGSKNGSVLTELQTFVHKQTTNTERNAELARQFQRIDPRVQTGIRQVLNVADPLTVFLPGDLDDETVAWLKDITKQAEAQKPTLPGSL